MARDVVPEMAVWIRDRMAQLRIDRAELLRRSGVTGPGLAPILRGERKRYQDRLKWPVCDALQLTEDSIDRMLRGEPPMPKPGAPGIRTSLAEEASRAHQVEATIEDLGVLLGDEAARRPTPTS